MREIIQIQVGQCGVMLGDSFWSLLRKEHGLDQTGHCLPGKNTLNENSRVFFNEEGDNQFVPRSIFVDLDHAALDSVAAGPLGKFYRGDNFVKSRDGLSARNYWAKGYYTEGADLIDQLLDVIRLETERAESLQGFQIVHSLGGGTGSGMGSLLLCKLREEFPDKMLWTWSLTETSIDECVLRPYNNMLAMHCLIENTDAVVYIDDDASYKACLRGRITKPTYNHLNTITANIMSNVTCSMRLDSSEFTSLRKISTNLVPFPRQHFLTVGTSPLNSEFIENTGDHSVTPVTLAEISSQLFEPQNMMLAIDDQNKSWKHLATMCSFRGTMHPLEITDFINVTRDKRSSNFVPWIPDNVKWTHCETSAPGVNMSGTYLASSTAVIDIFKQLETQFSALFRRKAFLYHYRGEGMDEMEFKEAHANMKDLIAEYQQYQDIDIETRLGEHYCSDDEVE